MIFQYINKLILSSFCSSCGSIAKPKYGLCHGCTQILISSLNPQVFPHPTEKSVLVRSIIDWKQDESEIKNRFMLMLKGEKSEEAWEVWAHEFIKQHRLFKSIPEKTLIIPIYRGKKDHSYIFAKAVSEALGYQFTANIIQTKQTSMKSLSKKERRRKRSKFYIDKSLQIQEFQRVIVVDDILTTGETTAALLSQINHENREVWVLAFRELSCDI